MSKQLSGKLRPASGISYLLHLGLLVFLPLVVLVLVHAGFLQLAIIVILLSKWRMFAVRPRFWPAIVRANSVDIMVGLSVTLFMANVGSWWQLFWAAAYVLWLVFIKPASGIVMTSVQAGIALLFGLSATYLVWVTAPLAWLILVSGGVCYLSARHFFDSFEEQYARLLAWLWAYVGVAISWLLGHWLLFYAHGIIAQPTLLLCVVGYGLAALYYFDHHEKLSPMLRRQIIIVMAALIFVILTFSDWGDKVV